MSGGCATDVGDGMTAGIFAAAEGDDAALGAGAMATGAAGEPAAGAEFTGAGAFAAGAAAGATRSFGKRMPQKPTTGSVNSSST